MGTFLSVPRGLLCAYGGRLDDANEIVASSRHNHRAPNVMHWRNPEHRELFLSGLRLAAGVTTSQTRQAGAATLVILSVPLAARMAPIGAPIGRRFARTRISLTGLRPNLARS